MYNIGEEVHEWEMIQSMLVAKTSKNTVINLTEKQWTYETLYRIRKEESFYCPVCENELDLKLGKIKIYHFSHQKNKTCRIELEQESEYHLKGKLKLYEWIKSQNIQSAKLEHYLPSISQRPDIFIKQGSEFTAIEFQCSTIPSSLLTKRTKQYKQFRIEPIWILGGKNVSRTSSHTFRISQFQWLFTRPGSVPLDPPSLLTFCPQVNSFLFLDHLIPFSKQTFFAIPGYQPLKMVILSDLHFRKSVSIHPFISQWIKLIRSHRLKPAIHLPPELKKLQKDLYEKNLTSIPLIPSEAFLPLKTSYLFYSHIFLWQTKILLFIHQKNLFEKIILEETVNEIKNDPSLERRDVTLLNNLTIGAAILEYLQALTSIGVLRNVQKNTYIKQREINWQCSLLELLKNDEMIMNKFVSKCGR
ncbi:hypothetical protein CYJ36_00430 [Bacillus sp. UMB0893]|nr:hypothetical protein CYJ36_00430 [Bacillus sp. UMB0893]